VYQFEVGRGPSVKCMSIHKERVCKSLRRRGKDGRRRGLQDKVEKGNKSIGVKTREKPPIFGEEGSAKTRR